MIEINISVNSIGEIRTIKCALDTYKECLAKEIAKSNYNYGKAKEIIDNELNCVDGLLDLLKEF